MKSYLFLNRSKYQSQKYIILIFTIYHLISQHFIAHIIIPLIDSTHTKTIIVLNIHAYSIKSSQMEVSLDTRT